MTGVAYDRYGDNVSDGFTDRNGNSVSQSGAYYYDPLGLAVTETGSGTPSSPLQFEYAGPGGANETITVNYESVYVTADFGCYTGYAGYVNLPSSVVYPDGSSYSFQYDSAGRLSALTLPSGGTITYGHSLTMADCSTGTANTSLTQTDPDGGVWTWSHTASPNQTVQTDPYGNTTVTGFDAYGNPTGEGVWQGNYANGGTELRSTTITSISQGTAFTTTVFGTPILYQQTTQTLDRYGFITNATASDWYTSGTPPLLTQQIDTYTAAGNGEVLTSAATEDGAGNVAAETTYGNFTAGGEPQTVAQFASASSYLTTTYAYNTNGSVASETGPNGAKTTFGSIACGFFPGSITDSVGTISLAWDCNGALPTQVKGYNGNATSIAYDSRWRQASVTAPDGAVTTFSYTPTSVESATPFNYSGSTAYSTDDVLTTLDSMGRPMLTQRRQGPGSSSFDTIETCYDEMSRPIFVSEPYTGAVGQTESCSSSGTTTTYNALSQPVTVTNADGGTVSYGYPNGADVLTTVGPAPAGENTKQKQEEFDGAGRLESVCELTATLPGHGDCAQASPQTGYWTEYTRNALGAITGVVQNAQSSTTESRSFAFDWLGRMTSGTNPESGTTSYTFDTDATCGTSDGDLVKRVDANGNVTCYAHDLAHRVTQISYPGTEPNPTPTKTFVYDSDTGLSVAGVPAYPASNLVGRLVEAYTGPASAPDTIDGFAYDTEGRPVWSGEATPHSGGWIPAQEGYHKNGAVATLTAENIPVITYGLDGEGRVNGATSSAAPTTLVSSTGTSYTTSSLTVELGTGDSDAYAFDAATGRMTQYQFTVNGATDTGTLGWHKDGEAKTFSIADAIAGATDNGVSCAYTHDDLGRLSEANCGAADNETFAWDAFGDRNTNTGPSQLITDFSFTTNNQISASTGGAYDSDGNLLQDPFNPGVTNTFDAEGRPVDLLGTAVTYDALGREVEAGISGSWGPYQILYAPDGSKLGLMNVASPYAIDIPLPGGGAAVYNAGGLQFFRHAGALGSAALTTNLSRALLSSDYYTPFGFDETGAGPGYRSFTGQKQLTDSLHSGGQYDFLHREYNPIQGRWWTPDPAGVAAVDPNNPQSWNAYAYVAGAPLEAVDPSGLSPIYCLLATARRGASGACGSGGRYGGGGHTIDGVDLGFSLGDELTGGGFSGGGSMSALVCPAGGCNETITADGFQYTPEPTMNGWQYQNDQNGALLSPGAGGEIGLPDLNGPAGPLASPTARAASGPPYLPNPDAAGLAALVGGVGAITRPLEMAATNAAIFYAGEMQMEFGAGLIATSCLDAPFDLFTCVPGGAAGFFFLGQGAATVGGSYIFLKHVTIPAFESLGQP